MSPEDRAPLKFIAHCKSSEFKQIGNRSTDLARAAFPTSSGSVQTRLPNGQRPISEDKKKAKKNRNIVSFHSGPKGQAAKAKRSQAFRGTYRLCSTYNTDRLQRAKDAGCRNVPEISRRELSRAERKRLFLRLGVFLQEQQRLRQRSSGLGLLFLQRGSSAFLAGVPSWGCSLVLSFHARAASSHTCNAGLLACALADPVLNRARRPIFTRSSPNLFRQQRVYVPSFSIESGIAWHAAVSCNEAVKGAFLEPPRARRIS